MRRTTRARAAVLVSALALLAMTGSASADVGESIAMGLPTPVSAGQNALEGSVSVTNTNTVPNQSETNTVTALQIALSCGAAGNTTNLCPSPDTGVFAFTGPATGAAGTACAGTTFTPSAPSAAGVVTLSPSAAVVLAPPGGAAGSDTCTVDFTFRALRVPTSDVDPAAGTQTRSNYLARSQSSVSALTVSAALSLTTTVLRASATLSTTATNASVGQPIRDRATVATAVPAGATGTVSFTLYGPTDTTCTAAPIFSSPNRPLSAGVATSADFVPSAPGNYRWRASYSGDANNLPVAAPCNAPGETSVVSDTTAPQTTITSGPSGPVSDTTPTFTFTSNEAGSSFTCAIDANPFVACTSPRTTGTLTQGAHTFRVRARDPSGNVDPTPATRSFTVDTVAPQTTITSGPSGPTNDSTPTFAFTSSQTPATFTCAIDAGAFAACTSPRTTGPLAAGPHTFRVRARDAAGNIDATPATRSFTVDVTAPQTTITSGPSGPTTDTTPTFAFTSSEAGSTFTCAVDAGAFVACTSPRTTAPLAVGAHTFRVRARDGAGNVDATPATRSFSVVAPAGPSIVASDFQFNQAGGGAPNVTVSPGTAVNFSYPSGSSAHNVAFASAQPSSCTQTAGPSSGAVPPLPNSPTVAGWAGNCTFTTAATYPFFCALHPDMTGSVTVSASAQTASARG